MQAEVQVLAAQLLQPLLQQLFLQQLWWQRNMSSRPRWQQCFLWQQLFLQQLLQPVVQADSQAGAAAAAQLGSQAFAAAQLGSQALAAAQLGSQAEVQPVLQELLQQLFLQQPRWQSNRPCRPQNRPWWQRFLQQLFLQQLLQPELQADSQAGAAAAAQLGSQAFAAAQLGSQAFAAAQLGSQAFAAAQLGSQAFAAAQLGSQPLSQPQEGAADSQQVLQPQSFRPSIRSSSSKPKLWLQKPALTASAPKNILNFIEQRLPKQESEAARHSQIALRSSVGRVLVEGHRHSTRLRGGLVETRLHIRVDRFYSEVDRWVVGREL